MRAFKNKSPLISHKRELEMTQYMPENILKKRGDHIVAVHTDVSKADDMEKLAQKTIDNYGEVNLLCNNAGVALLNSLTWEHSLSDWEWIMGVNMWGVIHGIRIFVPIMLKQDNVCHIINTSSLAGLQLHLFNVFIM